MVAWKKFILVTRNSELQEDSQGLLACSGLGIGELVQELTGLACQGHLSERDFQDAILSALSRQERFREICRHLWRTLTPRQQQVVRLAGLGFTNAQIAGQLYISPETVRTHLKSALKKFGLRRKRQLRLALAAWDFDEKL
jgi:RNA polymerase sigma factor (sigma-70 family)